MNKLEARALIENTGNYDEEDVEEIMDVFNVLQQYIGYEDKRRDKRFIVKFHDIGWYTPEKMTGTNWYETLFDMFCSEMYDNLIQTLADEHIPITTLNKILSNLWCGHYQNFRIDMPNITDENIVELAQEFYDEYNYEGDEYVKDYITVKNELQNLEDNYMNYWIEFLEEQNVDEEIVEEIKKRYKEDQKKKGKK